MTSEKDHVFPNNALIKYECEICKKPFAYKSHLNNHLVIHANKRPHKCEQCGASFKQKGNLMAHRQTHSDKRSYQCKQCDANFTQTRLLKKHIKFHTNKKNFKCQNRVASSDLIRGSGKQTESHSEKTYKSEECGVFVEQQGKKTALMNTHCHQQLYICEECMYIFYNKTYYYRHMRSLHLKNKPYFENGTKLV